MIQCSEDGDVRVDMFTKEQILKRLADKDDGDIKFFSKMPTSNDPMYWNKRALLIEGKAIVPTAHQIVETYDVE